MPTRRIRTAGPRDAAPPDLSAIYNELLGSLSGPQEVETPQLGRVTFRSTADIYAALMLLRAEQQRAAGVSAAGVFVAGYDRGLGWPTNGGC
jgi:hypothetical protein